MKWRSKLITSNYLPILSAFGTLPRKTGMVNHDPRLPSAHNLLTPLQEQFLQVFATLPDQEQFYLTGGTALAEFYLGHHLSYDLDFFTVEWSPKEIIDLFQDWSIRLMEELKP
jgi:hypothetical protein